MEEQGSNQFLVELQKLMPSEIAMTKWAPNMDLLAIATFDQTLQLFRISYKAQKVFQSEEPKPIKCVVFSLDSHQIAYGLMDGTVKIIKSENGEKVVVVDGMHNSQIETLTFANYHKLDPKIFMPFQKQSIQGKLILPVSPHKNCNKNAIIKINYFNHLNQEFVMLLSSQKERTLFLLNGFIPVAEISYAQIKLNNFRVQYSHYDGCFQAILTQEKMDHFRVHLVEYQSKVLKEYQQDIVKFHCFIGYVSQLLNFVEDTFGAIEMQLRQISSNYASKMGGIEDPNIEVNPCQELFRFLNLGLTSPPLLNFLSKSLYDSKVPQKLDETLTASFIKLHDLLLESTQNSLERAVVLLNKLKNMACSERFKIFGVSEQDISDITKKVNRIYNMTEVLLVESTEAKFDIRNLLVWLNKAAIKTSPENDIEIENTKSYLNKYTVDYSRLHNFLKNQDRFNLQHLKAFFSKTNQTRTMRIQPADFRLLHREGKGNNPELLENFAKMEKLLQVDDIIIPEPVSDSDYEFQCFKREMSDCIQTWKKVIGKPMKNISQLISQKYSSSEIGKMEFSQLFPIEIKTAVNEDKELIVYFVERNQDQDFLVRFNCSTKKKQFLFVKAYHIISIAVGNAVIAVFEEKMEGNRIIAQIANEEYNGQEIIFGKKISKVGGEADIDSSLRGLNSLIENKNKLIIFD